MITDLILNVLLFVPYLLLSGLSAFDFSLTFPEDMFEIIKDVTIGVNYVMPVERLIPIFVFMISLSVFKIIWAIVIRVKSFIPTMGS